MRYMYRFPQIKAMIEHWLSTPPNGYRGVNYARNPAELLLGPLSEDGANTLLRWMLEDIPILKNIKEGVNIVSTTEGRDKRRYFIQVGQFSIPVNDSRGSV